MIQTPIFIPIGDACGEPASTLEVIGIVVGMLVLAPFIVRFLFWWFDKVFEFTGGD